MVYTVNERRESMSQVIFEPAEEYARTYRMLHLDKVNQYFQRLVQASGIDIE